MFFRKFVSIPLVLIFLFSFGIRTITGFRTLVFGQDQARDVFLMRQFHEQGKVFLTLGPKASVGNFYLPPLYYQLDYLFSLISGFRPLTMQWVIILVESFTPVLLYLAMRRLADERTALISALIYCVLPLPVIFASFAWNPNMVPFFTTLALFCWIHHWQTNSRWSVLVGILALGTAISLHYQAVVAVPFAGLIFILSLRKNIRNLLYWILGGMLFGLTLLPYFYGEFQSRWTNERAIVTYFQEVHSQYFDRVTKPQFVLTFIPSFLERVLLGSNLQGIIVGRATFFVGLLLLGWLSLKDRRKFFLLFYFVTILVMLRVYKGDKIDYYMSSLFILPAILMAFLLAQLKQFAVIPLLFITGIMGYLVFSMPSTRGYLSFQLASAYIQSHVSGKEALVLFDDPEMINLFIYGFTYEKPIRLNDRSQLVVDICATRSPCDSRYAYVCWDEPRTKLSLFKFKYHYQQIDARIFAGNYEIVIGKVDPHSETPNYLDKLFHNSFGSDILLRDFQTVIK